MALAAIVEDYHEFDACRNATEEFVLTEIDDTDSLPDAEMIHTHRALRFFVWLAICET